MDEYISRDEVLEHSEHTENLNLVVPVRFIKAMKAAAVRPAKLGEWRKKFLSDTICCSECKATWSSSFKDMLNGFNYCPNCGADMRGDTD